MKDNAYFNRIAAHKSIDFFAKLPSGTSTAYWAWEKSIEEGWDEVVMRDGICKEDVGGFINALRESGIKTFVFAANSTAALENIHDFVGEFGCKFVGPCEVKDRYGEEIPGIRFFL